MKHPVVEFKFIRPKVFFFKAAGAFDEARIRSVYEEVKKYVEPGKDIDVITHVSGVLDFPWNMRKFVFEVTEHWFRNGTFLHVYVISPSIFVRMLAILITSFYKKISFSFVPSLEFGLEEIDSKANLHPEITVNQIGEVLRTGISTGGVDTLFYKKEIIERDPLNMVESIVMRPHILFSRVAGRLNQKSFEIIYEHLDRAVELCGGPVHYVGEIQGVTHVSSNAKRFFLAESLVREHQMVHKYLVMSPIIRAMYKIFSFINPAYSKTTTLIGSSEKCIHQLLIEKSPPALKHEEHTHELTPELLNDLTREELVEYLLIYFDQNRKLHDLIHQRIKSIFEIASSITWNEDFTTKHLELLDEQDPFHELFLVVNILQNDIGELISKLRFLNNHLESEVGLRTKELNLSKIYLEEQNIKLQKTNYELDTFIYRASHDLRAPLATMLGLVNLSENVEDQGQRSELLAHMRKTIHVMDQLLREITDLTKNTKLELQSERINFLSLVEESISGLGIYYPIHQVRIKQDIQTTHPFYADNFRLKMIIGNLVDNAIKYRSTTTSPFVNIKVETEEGLARITVEDNGQGVSREHLSHLFDMFYRANEKSSGSGLGLYMVKEAVQKMEGSIRMESEPGKGSTVFVEIPSKKL